LQIIHAVVTAGAEKALPLILAIHRQLHMTYRQSTPLNSAIWRAAGSPNTKKQAAVLKKLEELPEIIRVDRRRTSLAHYRVGQGSQWGAESME
jgi:hypothetical protein